MIRSADDFQIWFNIANGCIFKFIKPWIIYNPWSNKARTTWRNITFLILSFPFFITHYSFVWELHKAATFLTVLSINLVLVWKSFLTSLLNTMFSTVQTFSKIISTFYRVILFNQLPQQSYEQLNNSPSLMVVEVLRRFWLGKCGEWSPTGIYKF